MELAESTSENPADKKRCFHRLMTATEERVFVVHAKRVGRDAALDLTQETFLKIWKGYDHLDPSQNVEAYVLKIATSVLIDHFRKNSAKKRGNPISLTQPDSGISDPIDGTCRHPADKVIQDEILEELDGVASRLNQQERELYEFQRQGLSLDDIVQKTGRNKSSISPAWTRLKEKLRRGLSPDPP